MLGGCFLCFEGAEKVLEALLGHKIETGVAVRPTPAADARELEGRKVSGAFKTDLILCAEIVAMTLSSVPKAPLWIEAAVLAIVGIGITVLVYGGVAIIVKADDVGVALATMRWSVARLLGRALVRGMPVCLRILGIVGTAAMLWVGGGILVHGLDQHGVAAIGHTVESVARMAEQIVPAFGSAAEWVVGAAASGIVGLVSGSVIVLIVERIGHPIWRRLRGETLQASAGEVSASGRPR